MYDLVIKNGMIIDGTGSPSYFSDVAIENGKIVRVARGLEGKRVIDETHERLIVTKLLSNQKKTGLLVLKRNGIEVIFN